MGKENQATQEEVQQNLAIALSGLINNSSSNAVVSTSTSNNTVEFNSQSLDQILDIQAALNPDNGFTANNDGGMNIEVGNTHENANQNQNFDDLKITGIRADRSGGGALGYLQYKKSNTDTWEYVEVPDDATRLWDWDDQAEESDELILSNSEYVTGIYWYNANSNDAGAIQQIGFEIYDSSTQTTSQRRLNTYANPPVDLFDLNNPDVDFIEAQQDHHIVDFQGLVPIQGSGWGGEVPAALDIRGELPIGIGDDPNQVNGEINPINRHFYSAESTKNWIKLKSPSTAKSSLSSSTQRPQRMAKVVAK